MKKSILLGLGTAAFAMAGIAPITSSVQSAQTTVQAGQNGQKVQNNTPQPAKASTATQQEQVKQKHTPPVYSFSNRGVSPKEWGMYLQRTGRQKWTKSQRA